MVGKTGLHQLVDQAAEKGGKLILPPGVYVVSSPIDPKGLSIVGLVRG